MLFNIYYTHSEFVVSQTTMFFLFCPKYIRLLVRIIDKKKVFVYNYNYNYKYNYSRRLFKSIAAIWCN